MRLYAFTEVDQEAEFLVGCSQVVPDLLVKQPRHPFHRFHFHNDLVLNQQVESMLSNLYPTEQNNDGDFALHM